MSLLIEIAIVVVLAWRKLPTLSTPTTPTLKQTPKAKPKVSGTGLDAILNQDWKYRGE